ncbi:hypothetical protein GCM10020295_22360 [Streptomyces cinereospinus]
MAGGEFGDDPGEAEPTWWTCSSALGRPAMKACGAKAPDPADEADVDAVTWSVKAAPRKGVRAGAWRRGRG